ncbi:type I-E CRISPR-associated protein Cse1/CasA [uncultured Flavonifractor sp.]|uniref:type I-E CRISPR-associated protein Cse1/CasA n=1 Tax=uncultured Flavonifractor sp. TaxID=1193534 RepID=UPI00263700B3|nr:type I-E CRISPR-associated protein Cse1/CasA [uncultured Flavonifractor sp.]
MEERVFSLLEEPWICVLRADGSTAKLSLTEALIQAHQIRDLAGESKTQDSAMLRMLLAVIHTVFSRVNEQGLPEEISTVQEALRRWGALWALGAFPQDQIQDYLTQWQERFWLFHPERPFYQVPELQGTTNPAKKLNGALVESSNKTQLFSLWNGERKNRLTYDEAARWLVFLQGFGDTAAKKPSPKLSWLGSIGLIMAKGETLFETLMLNLVLWKNGTERWEASAPSWEEELPQEKLREIPTPNNQAALLTVQCRRALLQRENGWVSGYVEAAGDYFPKENAFCEQMTLWEGIKERDQIIGYRPRAHQPSRQMWRDFSVLMGQDVRKPGIVAWIGLLKARKKLAKSKMISFQLAGVRYGNMYCGIVDEFFDQLQMYSGLLDELGYKWQKFIGEEVSHCDQLAKTVGKLAYKLDRAMGGEGKSAVPRAQEQCYYRLDLPFRQWLLTIDPDATPRDQNEMRRTWRSQAKTISLGLGRELVDQGGTAALIGREVTEKIKNREETHYYCAPKAFNQFLSELKQWEV